MTYFHGGFSTSIPVYRVKSRSWLNQTMASSQILVTPYGTMGPQRATSHEPRNADAKVLGTLHHLSAVQHILIRCCWDHGTKGLDNKIVSSQTWEHVWYHMISFYGVLCALMSCLISFYGVLCALMITYVMCDFLLGFMCTIISSVKKSENSLISSAW